MTLSMVSMGIATLLALGLVIGLGAASLLSGAFHFLIARPKLDILKTQFGNTGFAFGLKWNSSQEESRFDRVRVRLFNPFGSPTQVDVAKDFIAQNDTFGIDVNMGPGMQELIKANGVENARVCVELFSSKDQVTFPFEMTVKQFMSKRLAASNTADQFNDQYQTKKSKPLYHTPTRSFIADPLPASGKALKIATNPEFAGEFASAGAADAATQENFAVAKVWIDPGCIVCDACEGIFPEVFEVTEDSCIIRPGAPLDDGLKIFEAAEACPVEVIKFTKA